MIAMEAQRYMRSQRVTNLSDTIRQFRQKMEVQRDEALGQALLSLNNGHDPEKVMGNLALINEQVIASANQLCAMQHSIRERTH